MYHWNQGPTRVALWAGLGVHGSDRMLFLLQADFVLKVEAAVKDRHEYLRLRYVTSLLAIHSFTYCLGLISSLFPGKDDEMNGIVSIKKCSMY